MLYCSGFKLLLSLALGYVLCILARKEEGTLKTLGYALGIGMIILSLVYALLASAICPYGYRSGPGISGKMAKPCLTMKMPGGMRNPSPMR
jgi:galactitol-specific phosphotransferase system IIC component